MSAGIPTRVGGVQYRSRLEAKWAILFKHYGWNFTYEPFDADGYIPDFVIDGDRPLLVEIKPAVTKRDYQSPVAKITRALQGHWPHDVVILGANPLPDLEVEGCGTYAFGGWLGEMYCHKAINDTRHDHDGVTPSYNGQGQLDIDERCWSFSQGSWFRCGKCRRVNLFHELMCFVGRPCGHYSGDNYLEPMSDFDYLEMQAVWREAGNRVQWKSAVRPARR